MSVKIRLTRIGRHEDPFYRIYWLNNGATPSDTVKSLLSSKGIIEKYNNSKKSAKKVKEDK